MLFSSWTITVVDRFLPASLFAVPPDKVSLRRKNIKTITWKKNYPKTFISNSNILHSDDLTVFQLKVYNKKTYKIFM